MDKAIRQALLVADLDPELSSFPNRPAERQTRTWATDETRQHRRIRLNVQSLEPHYLQRTAARGCGLPCRTLLYGCG